MGVDSPASLDVQFADLIPDNAEWQGTRVGTREIHYQWSGAGLKVTKMFTFHPEDYLLGLRVRIKRTDGESQNGQLSIALFQYQDPAEDSSGGWTEVAQGWKSSCYVNGDLESRGVNDLVSEPLHHAGKVKFAGFAHGYFLAAISPKGVPGSVDCASQVISSGIMRSVVTFPSVILKANDAPFVQEATVYYGPKYLDKLDGLSRKVGYDTGFEGAIDLGWFAFIARPLLWLLQTLQSFVVNWGLAIIFLTVIVKLATLHWSTKSMRSMKAMASLGPEIKKIQAKYKDDRQRQHAETMNLYKAHGVSPLAGCLPMLLQMPIWFALYRMLMAAAELYQAPFIPGWIDDLTSPDRYYVLPLLLVGAMILQSRLTPTTGDGAQQKMLKWGMPIMFGGFSFFFPSGLTLYILTNTGMTALHHLWLGRNQDNPFPQ